jgi:uncharacterized DUF497 family protein
LCSYGIDRRAFRSYINSVRITFDPVKRAKTLGERGLDFADAAEVFAGRYTVELDERRDYGEPRFISAGLLWGRVVVLTWTPRGEGRRIISMRYAHERESIEWRRRLG